MWQVVDIAATGTQKLRLLWTGGLVVRSLFLLIAKHSVPAVWQKLHLSSCADCRIR
jgi:hypothetical protein